VIGRGKASAPGAASVAVTGNVDAPITTNLIDLRGGTLLQMSGSLVRVAAAAKDPQVVLTAVGIDAFSGRQWLLDKVDRFIAENPCGYVFIEGDAGVGKTAFAAWLVKIHGYVSHFAGYYSEGRTTRAALQNLSAQLMTGFGLEDQAPGGMLPDWYQTPAGFESLLTMAASQSPDRADPLVLVVDGLDGAEQADDGLPLGLPSALPNRTYVIATYRTGFSPAQPAAPARCFRIDKDSPDNRDDIRVFLTKAVRDQRLIKQLAEAGLPATRFVSLLAERCGGIWVYLRYVLDELRIGLRRPDELDDLPPGLQEYYANQIRRWQNDPAWDSELLPLLATLGVVEEQLPAASLARLAGNLDQATVRRRCNFTLRPLLTVSRSTTSKTALKYGIYHASFREALSGSWPGDPDNEQVDLTALAEELGEATSAAHARIADTYLECFGGLNAGLPLLADDPGAAGVDDGYPLQHLARHLNRAGRADEIHRLLAAQHVVSDDRAINVWFTAHDYAGRLASYLDDLSAASASCAAVTDQALARHRPATALGTEIRYALMAASIASRSTNISADLLEQLLRVGIWSPQRGLDQVRRLVNPNSRLEAFLIVYRYLDADEKPSVIAEALATASAIPEHYYRRDGLISLIPCLTPELLSEALDIALALPVDGLQFYTVALLAPHLPPELLTRAVATVLADEGSRAWAISTLAPHLPPELLTRALAAATALPDEGSRAWAISSLAPHLPPELLTRALATATALTDENCRAEALSSVAPNLSPDQRSDGLARALAAATAASHGRSGAKALTWLAPYLPPDLLSQALDVAVNIPDEDYRSEALIGLVPHRPPELHTRALAAVAALTDDRSRCQALTELALNAAAEQRADVLARALAAAKASHNDEALDRLAPHLPPELLGQALAAAAAIPGGYYRAKALTSVAIHLPAAERADALVQGVAAALTEDGYNRDAALRILGPHLPLELLRKILTADTSDANARGEDLRSLAPYLPRELLAEALTVAGDLREESSRSYSLSALAPYLPPELAAVALALAAAMTSNQHRAHALVRLAPRVLVDQQADVVTQALAVATAINDNSSCAAALCSLIPHLSRAQQADVLTQALAAVTAMTGDYDRAQALIRLAPFLPASQRADLLTWTLADTADDRFRGWALAELAPLLPPNLLPGALGAAAAITDEKDVERGGFYFINPLCHRGTALIGLAPHLAPELLPQALDAARSITDDYSRAMTLVALAPSLSPDQRADVLDQAWNAAAALTESARADALRGLAPHLPPRLLDKALASAAGAKSDDSRATGLIGLAPHLPPELLTQAMTIATDIDDAYARAQALTALASRLPASRQAEILRQAIAAATAITGDNETVFRAQALEALAPQLPPELFAQALASAATIGDGNRALALHGLAPHVPPESLVQALTVALGIADDRSRINALSSLAPRLSASQQAEILPQALATALDLSNVHDRIFALGGLSPYLPPRLLVQSLAAVWAIDDDRARADGLASLAPVLPAELIGEALTATAAIADEYARGQVLASLAPHLPLPLLGEALALTSRPNGKELIAVLKRACALLAAGEQAAFIHVLRKGLDGTNRDTCLAVLAELEPVIAEIGGAGTIQECASAIVDVRRWWP
jgi:hypothetical protein